MQKMFALKFIILLIFIADLLKENRWYVSNGYDVCDFLVMALKMQRVKGRHFGVWEIQQITNDPGGMACHMKILEKIILLL